ncbi:hypothetical protein AC579_971 [Pseudocercospora musae]|uniref:Mid2 domain-containing protein n=1 Tax=Pseudocercospora musae TaxID=113226 RepID=A0A139IUA2_9PEZI|nr:hypothetical protein AC579_971 [Pseudocercospora musae]
MSASAVPLTTAYAAPTYCSLNPTTAGWGGSLYIEVEYSTVTVEAVSSDSYVLPSTIYSTLTSTPDFPQWVIGGPYADYLKTCEPSPGIYGFSPGVCPQAWTPYLIQSSGSLTSAICCPTGEAAPDDTDYCTAAVVTPVVLNTASATGDGYAVQTFAPSQATTISSGQLYHYGNIAVTWAESDLPRFTPASAPVFMKNGIAVDTSTMTQTSTPTAPTAPTHTPKPGLSTGALAGIGVGAGVVGLALLGAAIFLIIRSIRRRGGRNAITYDSVPYESSYETQQTGSFRPEAYQPQQKS